MARIILDNQFKIMFDKPIKVTEDNLSDLIFLMSGTETAIYDHPNMTVGPRKPNIKDVTVVKNGKTISGLLYTFERGLARTGQIGISSESIKQVTSTQLEINNFDIPPEEMTIEKVNIFENIS